MQAQPVASSEPEASIADGVPGIDTQPYAVDFNDESYLVQIDPSDMRDPRGRRSNAQRMLDDLQEQERERRASVAVADRMATVRSHIKR